MFIIYINVYFYKKALIKIHHNVFSKVCLQFIQWGKEDHVEDNSASVFKAPHIYRDETLQAGRPCWLFPL